MAEPERPDPDLLLARVEQASLQQSRGRLKIFFGAAPGVGKTYSMLQAAQIQKRAGVDVVAGVVETHGREDTKALLDGLDLLPRRRVAHRGITLEEFDLDAALSRRPGLILVDELAHTNAPGSRHAKRWQDVLELIDAGIDVYSTLNVQHLDSLNDVVAQITGIAVRETIPDSVLDQAAAIEIVDLPIDELRRRMEEGKVYFPEQARLAAANFFRPGNLIALRELALRRTADRVEAQMESYRAHHAIRDTWPVKERLMVSVGPSPFSAKLIRAAKRLAEKLEAPWIAVFVETPAYTTANPEVRERLLSSMRLASQLGAETVTLSGNDVAETLLTYARSRNVTKIVIGKQAGPFWKRIWRGSVLDQLLGNSGDIGVIAISGEPESSPLRTRTETPTPLPAGTWADASTTIAVVAACTLVSVALREALHPVNLVMVYLMGVLFVATRSTRRQSFLASVLSVAAFDFFCIPPYYTFAVSDYEYLVTFAVMLTVALIVSALTTRIRLQAVAAVEREARTHLLYRFTQAVSGEAHWKEAARSAAYIAGEVFTADTAVLLPDAAGKLVQQSGSSSFIVPDSELGIAQWAFDRAQKAGKSTETLNGASALYVPLRATHSPLGVLAIRSRRPDSLATPEHFHLLEVFCSQAALAMERAQAMDQARTAQIRAETEQMRSGLLSAVSHDLRTPLATITGAASSLRAQREQLSPNAQRGLIDCIEQEAERLSRLVNNLLDITRIESGAIRLNLSVVPLEEIIGSVLNRLDIALAGRPVQVRIPDDLPPIAADDVLLEQVFVNILDNASRYTPAASPLTIVATRSGRDVSIEICDSGPGFAPGEEQRIWEKFYRGSAGRGGGAGLGLAICKAIVMAHGGTIEASNRPEGGASFRIKVPAAEPLPELVNGASVL
jgi:two-component system sensor histidine kinase KdpD